MQNSPLIWSAFLSIVPISELRGGIPFAAANGIPVWVAGLWCVFWNALVPIIAFLFLGTVHKLLYKWKAYADFFDRFVEKTQKKVKPKIDKYGYWGLAIFVGIPLPVTGAWTGSLGAWILNMDRKKAALAIIAGVAMAGVIVSLVVGLGIGALSIFVKKV